MNEFDDASFSATARFLAHRNPHVTTDPIAFEEWMRNEAENYLTKPGYFGTYGFIIVAVKRSDGEGLYYKAGLDAVIIEELL